MMNVSDFWPFDLAFTAKTRTFHYSDPTGVVSPWTSMFGYDAPANALVYVDSGPDGKWTDTWFMQLDPVNGVIEFQDWYPQTNPIETMAFGTIKKVVMQPPIGWGKEFDPAAMPQVFHNSPVYNPGACTPPFAASGSGVQTVVFETVWPEFTLHNGIIYPDVLQFVYSQQWNGGTPTGARYFMAKGVGPIAVAWVGYNPDGSVKVIEPRADAVVVDA